MRLAWILFVVILLHGSLVGLTDDEAYYWVLAQKPALGYAYHPPGVALLIALSQKLLGWLLGPASAVVVRLPAALCSAGIVALGARWVGLSGGDARGWKAPAALVSLAGLFALSWMMVPDLPLFLGWTLAFVACWEICFSPRSGRWVYAGLGGGLALAILSKFSGVLAGASALAAVWVWAPRERRWRATLALALGGLAAAAPILWWNATHEWASILYQLRERHGERELSLARYARFWAVELVLAGPPLAVFSARLVARWLRGRADRASSYALAWAAPGAAVFFAQPLWADFKPHWALIAWWPLMMAMAREWSAGAGARRLGAWQVAYGATVAGLVLVSCHLPVVSWAAGFLGPDGGTVSPKVDVTNDLYGWADLRAQLDGLGGGARPVIGGRYQTASQAAFAMGAGSRVTMLPRDLKAMDEWPDLGVSEGQGPAWPRLKEAVYFVGDNRYDAGPEFPGARCREALRYQKKRMGYPAKTLLVWSCEP